MPPKAKTTADKRNFLHQSAIKITPEFYKPEPDNIKKAGDKLTSLKNLNINDVKFMMGFFNLGYDDKNDSKEDMVNRMRTHILDISNLGDDEEDGEQLPENTKN